MEVKMVSKKNKRVFRKKSMKIHRGTAIQIIRDRNKNKMEMKMMVRSRKNIWLTEKRNNNSRILT
jgi:hypothetical protein